MSQHRVTEDRRASFLGERDPDGVTRTTYYKCEVCKERTTDTPPEGECPGRPLTRAEHRWKWNARYRPNGSGDTNG